MNKEFTRESRGRNFGDAERAVMRASQQPKELNSPGEKERGRNANI